ncbi:TPA: hypothetical protein DCX15_04440 [bacterium]|nr:hypothetical protein [bacterium]
MEKYKNAIHKTDDVIARTGFGTYEPKGKVVLASLYLSQGSLEEAKALALSAYNQVEMEAPHPLEEIGAIQIEIKTGDLKERW